jgi:G3E family GTPase
MLTSGSFADLFVLQATLTLLDARKLKDPQYTEHAIFIDQLKVADVIVASKADCYQPDDLSLLHEFLQDQGLADRPCFTVENGAVQAHWLNAQASAVQAQAAEHQHQHDHAKTTNESAPQTADIFAETVRFPDSGFIRKDYLNDNSAINAQAFHSSGWIFSPTICFDYNKLYGMLLGLDVERMKAVFITDEGIFAFNFVDQVLSTIELDEVMDSRIEVIGTDPQQWIDLEAGLLAAKSEAF